MSASCGVPWCTALVAILHGFRVGAAQFSIQIRQWVQQARLRCLWHRCPQAGVGLEAANEGCGVAIEAPVAKDCLHGSTSVAACTSRAGLALRATFPVVRPCWCVKSAKTGVGYTKQPVANANAVVVRVGAGVVTWVAHDTSLCPNRLHFATSAGSKVHRHHKRRHVDGLRSHKDDLCRGAWLPHNLQAIKYGKACTTRTTA